MRFPATGTLDAVRRIERCHHVGDGRILRGDVEDAPHAPVPELGLPEDVLVDVDVRRVEELDPAVLTHRVVDPGRIARERARVARVAGDIRDLGEDARRGEHQIARHRGRDHEASPPPRQGDEQDPGQQRTGADQDPGVLHPSRDDRRQAPERDDPERVGEERPRRDQGLERQGEEEGHWDENRGGGERRRAGQPAREPDHEREKENGKDVEHVPLLDAERVVGCKGADLDGRQHDCGGRHGEKGPFRRAWSRSQAAGEP